MAIEQLDLGVVRSKIWYRSFRVSTFLALVSNTPFEPQKIGEVFLEIYQQPVGEFKTELMFTGEPIAR
jgi:hypothetical protein